MREYYMKMLCHSKSHRLCLANYSWFVQAHVPSEWDKCIINPIPKSSTSDRRDPLSYRGISLAPSMYKLYCSVLNRRLSSWA